jgi:uncharacterized membrane protein
MTREQQPALLLFVIGLMGLGALAVVHRDFAYQWQPVPHFPGREILALLCGLLMIVVGLGLLFRATTRIAVQVLFPFLVLWLSLKVPALVVAPQIEGVWLAFGEIAALFCGGWVLFARFSGLQESPLFGPITGERGLTLARILFGLAVIPIGLSHIIYVDITTSLVPAWLPFRTGWAYLTGLGQIACGLGLVCLVWARAAAMIETGMIALFALLVWGPSSWLSPTPQAAGLPAGARFALTAFFITWIIGAAALLVATNIPAGRAAERGPVAQQSDIS